MPLVQKPFGDIITFTRASTATFFDSAGVLQSAAIDAPRFDYDPDTLAARGFLIEEARTNLVLQSQDFANSAGPVLWVWPAAFVTGNTEVAPDGTTTADTVTSSGGVQSIYQSVTVTASTAYTFSVFVKLGTMPAADYKIAFYDNIAATFIAADIVPTQVPNTSSWTRISYTFTTPVGCTSVRVYPFRNSATIPSSTVFLWGAQLETGAFPTSYIPTTTTALTRSADEASVNTLSPWFNATEGTLYAEAAPGAVSYIGNAVALSDGSTNNRMIIRAMTASNTSSSIGVVATATEWGLSFGSQTAATTKWALGYKLNDIAFTKDGATPLADSSASIPVVNTMKIGADGAGNFRLQGHLRCITYYPRRLSNAELVSITS